MHFSTDVTAVRIVVHRVRVHFVTVKVFAMLLIVPNEMGSLFGKCQLQSQPTAHALRSPQVSTSR